MYVYWRTLLQLLLVPMNKVLCSSAVDHITIGVD